MHGEHSHPLAHAGLRQKPGALPRSPTWTAGSHITLSPHRCCHPGLALAGSESQELELGLKLRHSNVGGRCLHCQAPCPTPHCPCRSSINCTPNCLSLCGYYLPPPLHLTQRPPGFCPGTSHTSLRCQPPPPRTSPGSLWRPLSPLQVFFAQCHCLSKLNPDD